MLLPTTVRTPACTSPSQTICRHNLLIHPPRVDECHPTYSFSNHLLNLFSTFVLARSLVSNFRQIPSLLMSDAKSALSIPLHDIAPLVNKRSDEPSTQSPLLRPGLLFRIPSIEQANDEDNRELREEFNIKTIVNTRHGAMRYHRDNKTESYVSETWAVEKVLGVTSCHVYLRRGRAFAENLLNELPSLTRQ